MILEGNEDYFRYYYTIKFILYGGKFDECLDEMKNEFNLENYFLFLNCLIEIISNNDNNFFINKDTKEMLEDVFDLILKKYKNNDLAYSYFNELINGIKVNLNMAVLYDKLDFFAREASVKFNKQVSKEDLLCARIKIEDLIYSIDFDTYYFEEFAFGKIDLNEQEINEFHILSINTYLHDIKDLDKNEVFVANVTKLMNNNLSIKYRDLVKNGCSLKSAIKIKKKSKQILKRINA